MRTVVLLLISSLLHSLLAQAQSFQFKASVDRAQQSGYHRILLPPAVVGHLNNSLTDIRLYDDKQQEIPYQLVRKEPTSTEKFTDYELVSKVIKPNLSTTVVVRNRAKSGIRSLDIVLKNTNVGKKAKLSGSDDAQTWYAIDDAGWLGPTQNNTTTTDIKTLNFPLSDYEYYRLDINDSLSTPLNILRIGHYIQKALAGTYTATPDLVISQRDSSDKHTYIHLTRKNTARFDRLTIKISSPANYRRQATIGQFRTRKLKRRRTERWLEPLYTVDLSSSDSNLVDLPGLKTKDVYVVIDNEDNPPLFVRDVKSYQLTTYLLAKLTANMNYQLRFSDESAAAPVYDLTELSAQQPTHLPVIGVGLTNPISSANDQSMSIFTRRWVIWPVLVLVLLVLGLLSYRMLGEMAKTNQ